MKRPALLLALIALAAPAAAGEVVIVQPPAGERGLQIEADGSRARLLRPDGAKLRLPIRRGERIEELVEFESGWAATGTRTVASRRELAVVVDGAAGVERLRPVPERIGELRVRPIPLASAEAFAGLAWLEGDTPAGYEVRVAEWTGATWSPPDTVSRARRGGQAGLVGTVLDDGRWLLVWSASDGTGSELYWSVRERGRWTPPRRLLAPGREPDVTPSLVRVPGGALLVWARLGSSGYGLRATRFEDGWSAPRRVGPANAWSPRFADLAEAGRFLTHRSPAGWTALELDASGRVLRRAEIAAERRPVLSARGGGIAVRSQGGAGPLAVRWEGAP